MTLERQRELPPEDNQGRVDASLNRDTEYVREKINPLSYPDDLQQRLTALGTHDPAIAFLEMMTPRLVVLAQRSPEEQTALAHQGASWRVHREEAGLSEEEVAAEVGLSPMELSALERGFPPPEGLSPRLANRLRSMVAPEDRA